MHKYDHSPNNSGGNLDFGILNDRAFSSEDRVRSFYPGNSIGTINRWFFKYSHYLELPGDLIQRTQVNSASDLQYPKDFYSETLNHGDPSMENRVSFSKNTDDQHLSLDTSYHINLLQSDPLSNAEESIQRFPEIKFSKTYKEIQNTNIWYNFNADYVRFNRSSRPYDDFTTGTYLNENVRYLKNSCNSPLHEKTPGCSLSYDNAFDSSTDILRTGQRIDWSGSLYSPLALSDSLKLTNKAECQITRKISSYRTPSLLN